MRQSIFGVFAAVFLIGFLTHDTGAQDRRQATAEEVDNAIQALGKAAQGQIDENAVPGLAVAVLFRDKVVYAKGFGVKDTGTGEAVDADTVFQIASISKPIGSTVIAALIGEGKITWDSKIADLDPDFEMYEPWVTREITLRDLFSHRSGLPPFAGDLLEDLGFTREEVLHRLRYQHPATSFRSGYAYTNFGITAAAVAAAKTHGLAWEDAIERKLYAPLGMTSTSSRYDDFAARANRAVGHVRVDGKWVPKFKRQPDAQSPAGGVSSTVNDLAKWMRLQLANGKFDGEQIVPEAVLAETHFPQSVASRNTLSGIPQFYGLGWNVNYSDDGRLRLSHSGGFELGAGTNVNMSPSDQLGVVVLTNGSPTGVAEGLTAEFLDIAIYGKTTQEWLKLYKGRFAEMVAAQQGADYSRPPASPSPAAGNEAYLGTYRNDFFGEISVVESDGGLAIVQGPKDMAFAMKHYDRDVFTYATEGEMAVGTAGIFFTLGADGKAIRVLVENLDAGGEGSFVRVPE
jgi:CubicO group peptidase (beta-lactamase class C family)